MSETATTLIKGALRLIGAIATGETPTDDEMQDGLEAMKFMFRSWSMAQIRLYYQTQDTVNLTGASYYTIGSGGTVNTTRPDFIIGGYVRDANGFDSPIKVIDADKYRRIRIKSTTGTIEYVWYSPEYPLGKIYVFPVSGSTLYLDSMKPLTDPTAITSSIAFPPGYDEAIKFNLAVRLAPEYGKEASPTVAAIASNALGRLESRNFAEQIVSINPEIIRMSGHYNIDEG